AVVGKERSGNEKKEEGDERALHGADCSAGVLAGRTGGVPPPLRRRGELAQQEASPGRARPRRLFERSPNRNPVGAHSVRPNAWTSSRVSSAPCAGTPVGLPAIFAMSSDVRCRSPGRRRRGP